MKTKVGSEKHAARVFHPGEILLDELNERKLTQAEFSAIIDRPARTINEIIKGKRGITPETAEAIGAALGTTPDMWLAMQAGYDLFVLNKKLEKKMEEVKKRSELYNLFPIADLIRRKYITATRKKAAELEKKVLDLLDIKSIDIFAGQKLALMRVSEGDITFSYLKSWILLGKKAAKNLTGIGKYDKDKLITFAKEIKNYSGKENGEKELIAKLNEIGVRVIVLPHFSKTRADGAACWNGKENPVILLSLRYDRIDNFYFTLLHEIGHIVLHEDSLDTSFVDVDIYNFSEDKKEKEANEFASNNLGFKNVASELKNLELTPKILSYKSEELGVHPGLLIGHLQHKHLLNYNAYRKPLVKIKSSIPSAIIQQ